MNIEDSVFSENSSFSSNGGGGIYQYGGILEVNHSNFISNHATHEGGGILLTDANATISDSNFTENLNSVYNGGGSFDDRKFLMRGNQIVTLQETKPRQTVLAVQSK